MGFQIKNKQGIAIPLNTLDKEIAELFGVKCDTKEYISYPSRTDQMPRSNWFDTLGWFIHNHGFNMFDLRTYILGTIFNAYEGVNHGSVLDLKIDLEKVNACIEVTKHQLQILDMWKEKGYSCHQVKDY